MPLSSISGARPTLQMRHFRLAFVLPAAVLLLALAAQPLCAQDSDNGLLRRGPHGPRQPQPQQATPTSSTPPASVLPPIQPTTQPVAQPAPAQVTATVLNQPPIGRARVVYANGLLEVRADNSSLLQILHDISRETSMAITGGLADQRIFGDYGPASPTTVLATLLDGTGTNMLLKQDPVTGAPVELVLTQRAGASPPSSPNGSGFDDSPYSDLPSPRPSRTSPSAKTPAPLDPNQPHPTNYVPGSPFNPPNPPPPQVDSSPNVSAAPAPSTPAADTPPPAKNSASTPESIYQQLMQLQQQKAKAASTTPASSTSTPK
jgi:hypothetical protein